MNTMNFVSYSIVFLSAIFLSLAATMIMRGFALRMNIVDIPDKIRHKHKQATPLLGGIALFISFFVVFFWKFDYFISGDLNAHHWLGVFFGALIIIVGGVLDDKFNLSPRRQFIFPILAALCVVAGGVTIAKISNPMGGFIHLDKWSIDLFSVGGSTATFVVLSDMLVFTWLLGMMYTTKLLDGVDGLVCGITAIGSLIIFLFTMTTRYYQPDIGLAALILLGVSLGFLALNWYPAKIFLGEGGSLFLGFILGVLAIISGGKFAIALLIMGLPILDIIWTIFRRLRAGRSIFRGDRRHLHFRIMDLGLGPRRTVAVYYFFSAIFGASALFLQSLGKVLTLVVLLVIIVFLVLGFSYLEKKRSI